jgi:hypothetical protein
MNEITGTLLDPFAQEFHIVYGLIVPLGHELLLHVQTLQIGEHKQVSTYEPSYVEAYGSLQIWRQQ